MNVTCNAMHCNHVESMCSPLLPEDALHCHTAVPKTRVCAVRLQLSRLTALLTGQCRDGLLCTMLPSRAMQTLHMPYCALALTFRLPAQRVVASDCSICLAE